MPAKKIFTQSEINSIIFDYVNTSLSTRDIAKKFSCAYNTINKVLKENNITFNGSLKISHKMVGKKYALGRKATQETREKLSKALKGKKPTTLGKIYTEQERKNISEGVKRGLKFSQKNQERLSKLNIVIKTVPKTEKEKQILKDYFKKVTKARDKCKALLRRVLKITGRKKVTKTYDALGYTEKELIKHIEAQFRDGMNWKDRESFHIDHITPVSWFLHRGITDPKIINALSNLRPLLPHENRAKKDDLIFLI